MTDEEKAKKYFEDSKDYYDPREPITDRQLRQIYLDGITEGRKEKWHDLRKDPNDLPKDSNTFVLNQDGEKCRKYRDLWFDIYGLGVTVIAWCEIPKFKE